MSHRLILTAICVWSFAGLTATTVHGQRGTAARINRAASRGASARLGLVGGLNTGRYGDPLRLTEVAPAGLGTAGRGLSRPNFYGAGWAMGRVPAAPLPQAFLPVRLGASAPATVSPFARALRGAQTRDVSQASRLAASLRLSAPLTGIVPTEFPLPNRPYFAPEPAGTAFHDFFGLTTADAQVAPGAPVPEGGWVGILEQENAEAARQKSTRALEEFKAATREPAEGRLERLSEAQWALCVVRDLDREAYIPSLLLVHVALEKRQLSLAITHLAEAAWRHPAVFVERPDLASYFGEPERFERTARDHLWIGDENPSPAGYAIQAYCAWILNDRVRAREALDKMSATEATEEMTRGVSAVQDALAAAVR